MLQSAFLGCRHVGVVVVSLEHLVAEFVVGHLGIVSLVVFLGYVLFVDFFQLSVCFLAFF